MLKVFVYSHEGCVCSFIYRLRLFVHFKPYNITVRLLLVGFVLVLACGQGPKCHQCFSLSVKNGPIFSKLRHKNKRQNTVH
jgi:hypothetical protein